MEILLLGTSLLPLRPLKASTMGKTLLISLMRVSNRTLAAVGKEATAPTLSMLHPRGHHHLRDMGVSSLNIRATTTARPLLLKASGEGDTQEALLRPRVMVVLDTMHPRNSNLCMDKVPTQIRETRGASIQANLLIPNTTTTTTTTSINVIEIEEKELLSLVHLGSRLLRLSRWPVRISALY